jgi:hypothetical protein
LQPFFINSTHQYHPNLPIYSTQQAFVAIISSDMAFDEFSDTIYFGPVFLENATYGLYVSYGGKIDF